MPSQQLLAKLTRPRLFSVVPRERLYHLLDQACTHPVVWVSGPPGSGKTTLVSGYLSDRQLAGIWYQADSGDVDLATFFYYMGLAVAQAAPLQPGALPLLTPEYLADLTGFTRRYFRDLFSRLARDATLVIDDFHVSADDSQLTSLMATAFCEIPEGITVIVVSRGEPPKQFAGLLARRHLVTLGWNELRLTLEESRQLVDVERVLPGIEVERLHQQANGWAAGLVLMLERHVTDQSAPQLSADDTHQAVFDYFAGEIIDKMSPDERRVLLSTAFLQEVSPATAARLSGTDAAPVLAKLHAHNLFTERRSERPVVYRYHDLFRSFLQRRAEEFFGAVQLHTLFADSAAILELQDKPDQAIALYCAAEQWPQAKRLILAEAATLIGQSRGQTVIKWIEMLPQAGEPWLLYWLGAAQASIYPASGRAALQQACDAFRDNGDRIGRVLCAAAISETLFSEWLHFEPLDSLTEILVDAVESGLALSREDEMRVRSCLVATLICRQPNHPILLHCVEKVQHYVEDDLPLDQRFSAARNLLHYFKWTADFKGAQRVFNHFLSSDSLAHSAPATRLWLWESIAYMALLDGNFEESHTALLTEREIATKEGLPYALPMLDLFRISVALGEGDIKTAEQILPLVEHGMNPKRHNQIGYLYVLKIWLALLRNELPRAVGLSIGFDAPGRKFGAVYFELWAFSSIAQVWALNGDADRSLEYLVHANRANDLLQNHLFAFQCQLTEAYAHWRAGNRSACRASLTAGLRLGREHDFKITPQWVPVIMSQVFAEALAAGIEVEYVKKLIALRGLLAPAPECESWPWPIRIMTLGRFQVLKDNAPITFSGKSQQKPMEMLRVLIAVGAEGANADKIARILWPETDKAQSKGSFDSTLYRLRKLLGYDKAITLSDATLALNPEFCWLDLWAVDRLCAQLQALAEDERKAAASETILRALMRLYRGHFLKDEDAARWLAPTRAHFHGRFLNHAIQLGKHFEADGRWAAAAEVYQAGLESDHLGEELYRRLMICHEQRGERAAALEVYRRCRDMLSIVLGIAPANETQVIYQRLLGQ